MKRATLALLLALQISPAGIAHPLRIESATSPPAFAVKQGTPREREPQSGQQRQQQQQPAPAATPSTQTQTPPGDDDVVRITTNLVQVDAVVTDKKGRAVTDLTAADFEILEDGKPQPVTNFSFIDLAPAQRTTPDSPSAKKEAKNAPPTPTVALRPEQVRRTIALVVDDLSMSFASVNWTREALKKFVREQMQPGDAVAVIRTSAGVGALEQVTNDKRQLMAAIERLRWLPRNGNPIFAIEPVSSNPSSITFDKSKEVGSASVPGVSPPGEEEKQKEIASFREQTFTVGTLGALNYLVRGLKDLPGRKAVVLFSDGFYMEGPDIPRVYNALERLVELANRSAVTFYSMDPRGLIVDPYMWTAGDATTASGYDTVGTGGAPTSGEAMMDARLTARTSAYNATKAGPNYLAERTGGFFTLYVERGMRRMLEDQRGYYLIGYRPDPATFNSKRLQFRKISVRVKRPDLSVRTRTGFFNVTDSELRSVPRTRDEKLVGALMSPFSAGGIDVRLTSLFLNDARAGSFMRSLLHLDARDLTFTTEPDGQRKVVIDVAAITFGEADKIVDGTNRTYTIRVSEPVYRFALRHGLRYEIAVPVKKAGPYQLRIAVRDQASDRIGTVSQFIEVPDLSKGRLALSGLLLEGASEDVTATEGVVQAQTVPAQDDQKRLVEASATTDGEPNLAVRRKRLGEPLDYGFVIYNAKLDKKTGRPQLTRQTRLFRDGQLVYQSEPQPLDLRLQMDLKRMLVTERLRLSGITPGEYILQIVVTDQLAKEKYRMATQWIDFEVVR